MRGAEFRSPSQFLVPGAWGFPKAIRKTAKKRGINRNLQAFGASEPASIIARQYTSRPMRFRVLNQRCRRALFLVPVLLCSFVHAQDKVAAGPVELGALTLAVAESWLANNNRDIAVARRALEQSQADVLIAGQRPNPQLSLAVQNINPSRGIGAGNLRGKTVDSVVRVDQLIERGDKAELRVETARRFEAAAGQDIADVSRQQMLALRNAYFDLLAAQEKFASSVDAAQLFGRSVDAAQLRLKAGDLAAADVARIRVDALRAQNDARAAEGDMARARLVLAYLVGFESSAATIKAVSPWPRPRAASAVLVTEEQIEQRADVRAALARLDGADKARALARALRARDVSVGAQYEHWPNQADANNQGTGSSFGVALSVPLFLRHQYEGDIARAQADWYAARDQLERTRAQARAELAKAATDLAAARERLLRFDGELLPEALRAAAAAEFAFRNGAIGVMDLLDSRRVLKTIQADVSTARAEHAKALAAFDLGRGLLTREGE